MAGCRTEARRGGALNAFNDLPVKGAGSSPGIEKAVRRISDEGPLLNRLDTHTGTYWYRRR